MQHSHILVCPPLEEECKDVAGKKNKKMPSVFKTLRELKNFSGKKVIIRVDLNLPVVGGAMRDDFRLRKILPAFEFLKKGGARTLIISHIENKETDSLEIVYKLLADRLPALFAPDLEKTKHLLDTLENGGFILLENLRRWEGEKENDEIFARSLASLADIYVNEAFSVSHRRHASIVSLPKFLPAYGGLLFEREIENLSVAFSPPRPFLFILGGAKFETKLPLIEKFLGLADHVFIGGALANDLLKAKGREVGVSKVSGLELDLSRILVKKNLFLPIDVVVENSKGRFTKKTKEISKEDRICDSGEETVNFVGSLVKESKFVLWNGPLGCYEKGFADGSEDLARLVAAGEARSVVGGGDTAAVISKLGLENKFSFVSTGGGAMLEFLATGTLPGVEALKI